MQSQLALHLKQMGLAKSITVEYLYLPPYSPKLNLVEYVIHLALAVVLIVAGHMYRTNWSIGHSMKEMLEAHKGPFREGHKGLYEVLTTS